MTDRDAKVRARIVRTEPDEIPLRGRSSGEEVSKQCNTISNHLL